MRSNPGADLGFSRSRDFQKIYIIFKNFVVIFLILAK